MARKKLNKDTYRADGGPVERLLLPWPKADVPPKAHLPLTISFGPEYGHYSRQYNPETDEFSYRWVPATSGRGVPATSGS